MKKLLIVLTLLALIATPKAQAASFQNGSFEINDYTSSVPFSFTTLGGGNTQISDWTVTGDSLDLINQYWTASNGSFSLDLAGNNPGGIEQTFTTTPGLTYYVSFDMSGNPDGPPNPKDVLVSAGSFSGDFTYTLNGSNSENNMQWQTQNFSFVADNSGLTTLAFTTNEAITPYGPALDNVNVTPAPEPSSMVLGFMSIPSIMGFLGFRRRKNQD